MITTPEHRDWLDGEARRLLAFGAAAALPGGGAGYLDDGGRVDPSFGVQAWITARTVHSFALGHLLGVPGAGQVAAGALAGLRGDGAVLRDEEHGGWFHAVAADGTPDAAGGKSAYDHAFVVLAGASASLAGIEGGRELLDEAADVFTERFWDEEAGRPVDSWDLEFETLDGYRGLNSTMHSVEAMLTAADAFEASAPDEALRWRERAARCVAFVVELAAGNDNRLPEHFGPDWVADLELNKDRPGDQFKPYGATPGHGLEWARLLLHLEAALPTGDAAASFPVRAADLLPTAVALFDRAVADAWAADGADGFVYTTDWSGTPVVRTRMHWVLTEALATAAALFERTGEQRFADQYATWWEYARTYLLDLERGSWHHELDPSNTPTATVWPGKPDVYHALQATLVPRLPLAPTFAAAMARGDLR